MIEHVGSSCYDRLRRMVKILLIDDSRETETLLRSLLGREGFDLTAATDAAEGLRVARVSPPDLILMDLSLPEVAAWRSIREIRNDPALSGIPILAMATPVQGAERERALAAGCNGFVTKPIDGQSLLQILSTHLDRGKSDETLLTRPLAISTPGVRSRAGARILLVSRDPGLLATTSAVLRDRRFAVEAETSAAGALRRLETGSCDLVLVDRELDDIAGEVLASKIRAGFRERSLPVMLLVDLDFELPAGAELWADDFLTKPVTDALLLARVRTLLRLSRALIAERQRSRELSVLVRQMHSGVVLLDETSRITVMNQRGAELLGLDPGGLEGRSVNHLFRMATLRDAENRPVDARLNPIAQLRKQKLNFSREIYQRTLASGRTAKIEISCAAMLNGRRQNRGYAMVLREAPETARSQRELIDAYEHLMEVDQLKSRFLSTVSHELRTPLNTIILLAHLLTTEPPEVRSNEKRLHDLEIIRQSGTALLHMINNLLDLAKIEAGEIQISPATFEVRPFLEETVEILAPQAESKGLRLRVDISPSLPDRVTLDRERVRQVLLNLLSNAIKFTSRGEVTLECGLTPTGASISLTVRDAGLGIPPEKLAVIFEPFRQIEPRQDSHLGSGLGLSIVKELVHRMEGEITVDTAPGRGSSFRVTLPRLPLADDPADATQPLKRRRAGGRRILIVEDDQNSRYGLKSVLEMEGYEVDDAATAQEARARLSSESYDAVLLDITLPDGDGTELIAEARSARPSGADLPILALTGRTSDEDRRRIEAAGATGCLFKPVDVRRMLKTLDRLLAATYAPRA